MSTQTVRTYEKWGLIPPSTRGTNGYRQYTELHLYALEAVRALGAAYGLIDTGKIMRAVHQGDMETALELIDSKHAEFHRQRLQIRETVAMLRNMTDEKHGSIYDRNRTHNHWRINDVAKHLGIRESAIRFWEHQGLIEPKRDLRNGYRLYDGETVRMVRVIHILRMANYSLDAIRPILIELKQGNAKRALSAAEQKLLALKERSHLAVAAMGAFSLYLNELAKRHLI